MELDDCPRKLIVEHSELITTMDAGKLPWLALSFVWLISDRVPEVMCCWGLDTGSLRPGSTTEQETTEFVGSWPCILPLEQWGLRKVLGLFRISYFTWLVGRHLARISENASIVKNGPGEYEKSLILANGVFHTW